MTSGSLQSVATGFGFGFVTVCGFGADRRGTRKRRFASSCAI